MGINNNTDFNTICDNPFERCNEIQYLTQQGIKELKKEVANVYNSMGVVHKMQGKLDTALTEFQKALQIYQKNSNDKNPQINRADISSVYSNIGSVYDAQGDLDTALKLYKEALKIKPNLEEQSIDEIEKLINTFNKMNIPEKIQELEQRIKNTEDSNQRENLNNILQRYKIFEMNKFKIDTMKFIKKGSVEKIDIWKDREIWEAKGGVLKETLVHIGNYTVNMFGEMITGISSYFKGGQWVVNDEFIWNSQGNKIK